MHQTPIGKKTKWEQRNIACLSFPLIFIIVITCQGILQCQPIFSPGVVITTTGDTLRGEIGEFGNGKNYQECVFRQAIGSLLQHFTPSDIKSYMIDDRRYFESRTVPKPGGGAHTVFAEWIIKGSASILRVKDDFYLHTTSTDTLQKVSLQVSALSQTREEYMLARRDWVIFLHALSKDCLSLKYYFANPDNLKASEKNLIQIIKLYNVDCLGTPYVEYGDGLPFMAADLGLSLTLDYTQLHFTSTAAHRYAYLLSSDFATPGPALGMSILLRSPRRLSNFSIYLEPSIRYYLLKADTQLKPLVGDAIDIYYNTKINWIGLGSPLAVRYTIPNQKNSLSFQVGPVMQLLLQTKAETLEEVVTKEFLQERDIVTTNRFTPLEFSAFQLSFGAQVNFREKWSKLPGNWEFALGFQRGGGIALEDTQRVFGLLESTTNAFFIKAIWLW